jgi:serine/threonine-protein kinase
MDADLARVGQGLSVSSRTEDAATQIISRPTAVGGPPTGATVVQARPAPTYAPPPPVYYDYDEPIRRRPIWPWLVALLFVVGAVVGGFFLYNQVSDQLNANKPVAVDRYVGERETLAVQNILGAHLKPHVVRKYDDKTPETYVFDQDPQPGSRLSRGGSVTVFVSLGKPKTEVPDVVGKKSDAAVGELTAANLTPRVVEVNSDRPAGTVLAQDPPGGKKVVEGTKVRINVSKGPKPIGVPSVVGQPFDSANGILQGAGFRVSRVDVASTQPKGIVTAQNPAPNTFQGKGTTITVNVSKGPTTSTVPDVTSQDQATAISNLQGSGFKARVVRQDTGDATQDGIVLDQTPPGGTQAKPGSSVTITVGRFTGDTTTGDTTTTPTTP